MLRRVSPMLHTGAAYWVAFTQRFGGTVKKVRDTFSLFVRKQFLILVYGPPYIHTRLQSRTLDQCY